MESVICRSRDLFEIMKESNPKQKNFSTILIANRGEIACRVIRTARSMGYETVAVYSEPDKNARHVKLADRAIAIGGRAPSECYLSIEKIIDACKRSGADAVHPGYGFLSENADFAQACQDNGLIFIGPPAQAINAMGNKSRSKELMLKAGVPCIPGYQGSDQSPEVLVKNAKEIGFPLMIKAAAGGGGRGLRLAYKIEQVAELLQSAKAEAEKAFGSGELLLEKALIDARHVEIQVFADQFGNAVHLGERDCSIQRRHQKVFEESPAVGEDLRKRMGESSVRAAKAINYVGAGTVEFLLDKDGQFYFLEMNTRLQVEHPVTELVTGFDLVEWQLNVAAGKPLPVKQEQVQFTGHAIEARLCAEDPANNFRPQAGKVVYWEPAGTEFARTDHGLNQSDEVTPYYDSMVAKVIAYGADREEARRLLDRALCDTTLLGLESNREFLIHCLRHEEFKNGRTDTGFIARTWKTETGGEGRGGDLTVSTDEPNLFVICAAAAEILLSQPDYGELTGWSSSGQVGSVLSLRKKESNSILLRVTYAGPTSWRFTVGERTLEVSLLGRKSFGSSARLQLLIDGEKHDARCFTEGDDVHIVMDEWMYQVANVTFKPPAKASEHLSGDVRSPSNGQLVSVSVEVGQFVERGSLLCVVEAMKLMQSVCATTAGHVTEILVQPGKQVTAKQILIRIDDSTSPNNAKSNSKPGAKADTKQNATLAEV